MKKNLIKSIKLFAIFFVVGFLFFNLNTNKAEAATYSCVSVNGATDWNLAASWTGCNSTYPGNINNSGNTINVTFQTTGAQTLTLSGALTYPISSITFPTVGAVAKNVVLNGQTLTVTGTTAISRPATSGTNTLTVGSGTLTTGALTLGGTTAGSRLTIINATTGTITTTGGITYGGAASQFTTTGAAIINITGTVSGAGTLSLHSTTTTNFIGTVALNSAHTWGGLTEVDSGTTTLGATTTFTGATLVRDSATLRLGAFAFTQTGNLTVGEGTSGNVSCPSAASCTGLKKFTGNITVNAGGVFDFTTSSTNATVSLGGTSYSHSGSTFNTGTGTITITGTGAMAFAGSSNMTFGSSSAGVMTIPTNRALTNSKSAGILTIGALTISSPTATNSFTLATNTTTTTIGNLTFSANVTANNQTITLQGTADLNVGGNLVMTGVPTSTGVSQIVCDGTGTSAHVDVTGTTAITAATTAVAGKNIVDLSLCSAPVFSSGGLITITGNTTSLATSFPELKVGSSGVITASAGITTATNTNARLSTGSGSIINLTGALTLAGTASLTNINANTELKTTGTASLPSTMTWPGSLNVVSGTTTLAGVATTISGTTTISGNLRCPAAATCTNTKTFTGLVTVTSGGSFNLLTGNPTVVPSLSFGAGATMNSGATDFNTNTGTTTLTATQAFTSASNMTLGAVVVNSGVTLTNSVATTLNLTSLTLASGAVGVVLPTGSTTSVTGAVAFTANATSTNTAITMSGTAALSVGGALTFNTPSSTGTQTLDVGVGTLTVTGLTTINGGASAASTITTSTGTLNLNGGLTYGATAANARLTTTGAAIVNFVGAWAGSGTTSLDSTTTFNTSGTTSFAATMTGSGALPNLNVLSGTTTLGGVAITVNGATNITGSLASSSATGTKTFTGLVTVNAGGVFDLNSFATVTSFGAGIVNNSDAANSFRTGSGTTTFVGNISGSGTGGIVFPGAVTIASGTTTNSYTAGSLGVTIDGTLTLTGNWTQGSGTTLYYGSTNAMAGAGTLDASTNLNTVNYDFAGVQTVKVITYRNLTLSNSGIKTAATSPTVNGVLSMEGTATIAVTTGVVTYGSSATLQYNTTTSRTSSSEEWITTFNGSGGVIIGSTGTITLDSAKVLDTGVPLTIASGASLNTSASNFQITFSGNFDNNGGTFTANASPIVIASTATQSIDGYTTTGLTSMTKTSGTATLQSAVSGAGLTINGSGGTLNLGSGLTHTFSGDVTLTAGTLHGGSSTLTLSNTSATVWNGTGSLFTPSTSTVNFSGANQTLAASATTFNNLTFSGSGTKTFTSATTINGDFDNQGGGATYATWNPSDKATAITLSNGNLTETGDNLGYGFVRATQGKSSGKWYWELYVNESTHAYPAVISATPNVDTGNVGRTTGQPDGWSISEFQTKWNNDTGTAYGNSDFIDGNTVGVALDMDAGEITFYINNVSQGVAFTGLTGTIYPAAGTFGSIGALTANFGASAFTYTPPNGYNSGVYNGGGTVVINTGNQTITMKGNFTNTGTALDAGSSNIILDGTATQSIAGFTTTGTVSMTKTGGIATLQGNLNAGSLTVNGVGGTIHMGSGRNHTFTGNITLTNGAINGGGSDINTPVFLSSNTNNRTIILGNGTWNLTGTGTVWDMTIGTNANINPGASTIKLSDTSVTGKTFAGGGQVYKNVWFAGGSGGGNYTITGSNAFYDIKDNGEDGDAAHSILIASDSTQHVSTWNVTGSPGNLITINSTAGGAHTLIKDINGAVNADYLNIQRSIAQPQGGIWFAGTHSVNNQFATGGSGWFFNLQMIYKGGGSGGGGEGNSGAGTCNDGIQNGNETGVDTGGRCDAFSGNCQDGIQNGNETGVDTGGRCGGGGGGGDSGYFFNNRRMFASVGVLDLSHIGKYFSKLIRF